jgi:hypothetical protein
VDARWRPGGLGVNATSIPRGGAMAKKKDKKSKKKDKKKKGKKGKKK